MDASAAETDQVRSDEQRLLRLAESMSGVGRWRYDIGNGEVTWSDEVYRIHGVDRQSFKPNYDKVVGFYHPDDRSILMGMVERAVRQGIGYDCQLRIIRPDGELRHVTARAECLLEASGATAALVGVFQDVTAHIRALAAVEQQEAEYRLLADYSTDIIVRADRSGQLLYVSPACRSLGYEPEELVGTSALHLLHPDDLDHFIANTQALFRGEVIKGDIEREHRFRTASGDWVWLEGNPKVRLDKSGMPFEIVNVFRDVTERRDLQELAASQAKWRGLAEDIAGVGYWRLDVTSGAITWSKQMFLVYGLEPGQEPPLERAMAMVHPEDRMEAADRLQRALKGEGWVDGFTRLIRPNGEIRYVEGRGVCERGATGAVTAVFGTMVDVTHHKVAELEIADSEARYRLLAQNVTDMIVTTDLTGRILYSSPSCQSVMGYSPVELICTKAVDRTHPDDVAEMVRVFTAVAAGAPPERLRWRGKHKLTGDWIWLESKPSLIRDPETGAPSGFLDVIRDVSEQQAAEALIAESEGRYRLLAENVTDMIVTSTLDGRTSYVSPAAAKLTGYTVEEATGVRTLDLVHPDDGPVMIKAFRALVSGAAAERIRWRGKHKSGGWTWLESMPALVTDGLSGEPAGFVDVVRDVTAQVTQEEALLEARAVAEAATAVKTEFLANMSHELRTPLTSILGFAELLRGHVSPGGEGSRYLDRVAGASSALMSIVNDILDFSKLEAGQVEVELRPVDPAALFEGVVQLLAPQANEKDVTLSFCADASVPEVGLMDDTRVRQVLLNLMSNAVKFTACGEVRVTLTSRDGATIRCEVSDTGPGIPRDRLDRLFQRFSQVDASTTRAFGGTGLGLAICKGLVEAMGGRIGVESCVGRGSTFWFELGCEKADLAPTSAAAGFAQDMSGFGLAGLRVLVADDNPVNRELVRLYLTAADIEVTDVASGEDAVEAAMAAPFDLIMMDIRMPGAGGPVSAKRIREERGPNDITPIIAFTADADTGSMPAEWGHAFNDRVGKPIVAAELFSVLARWGLGSELAPQLAIAHV